VSLHGLTLSFEITATVIAVAVAWKRPEHRPVAAFLAGTVLIDVVRLALQTWIIRPGRAEIAAAGLDPTVVAFTGWVRAASDLDCILFLAWPAGLAALSLWVYLKRRPWPVAGVYALASTVLLIGYSTIRYAALQQVYLATELAALTVGIGALGRWIGREAPRLPQVVTSCILVTEIAQLAVGPWRYSVFGAWSLAHVMYSALYAVLIVLQIGALWIIPSPSR
jgi:hypothetical protein